MARTAKALEALVELVATLRGPHGCPWDRAQTHESLVPFLLEEAYELAETLRHGNPGEMRDELGDVLLQVCLHARIAEERGAFDLADVANSLKAKLVRRHPHVFGGACAEDADQVRARWDEIKRSEGSSRDLERPALLALRKHLEVHGGPTVDSCARLLGVPRQPPEDPTDRVAELLVAVAVLAREWRVEPELALRAHLDELRGETHDPSDRP